MRKIYMQIPIRRTLEKKSYLFFERRRIHCNLYPRFKMYKVLVYVVDAG